MKYVMMIIHGDDEHSAADEAGAPSMDSWFETARERGAYDLGVRLDERETARMVRVRGGRPLVTDGPFAETREWIAGFALLEASSIEDAIDLAQRNPAAHWGRVEVRPVHSFGGPILGEE
ncbi:transcription initiation protein [Demequina activiva]|uniref:Transcription initiation protein n=2 Tax=Demequina activiva TaxID=1582364 RepID=A0A919Q3R4_9MICO|nr:transcription initiation protein [Demequina activiva]